MNTDNPAFPAHEPTKNIVDSPQIVGYPTKTLVKLESSSFSRSFQSTDGTDQSRPNGPDRAVNLNPNQEPEQKEQASKIVSHSGAFHSKPGTAKPARSLRIHLNFKESDNGFEKLFHDLSCFSDDVERSQHIKRLLVAIGLGIDISSWPALENISQSGEDQRLSFNVNFRMSTREIGLEALNIKLCEMNTTGQRNQYVKRLLFNAYINAPKQVLAAPSLPETTQTLLPTPIKTPIPVLDTASGLVLAQTANTASPSKSDESKAASTTGFGSLDSCATWSNGVEEAQGDKAKARPASNILSKRKSSLGSLGCMDT